MKSFISVVLALTFVFAADVLLNKGKYTVETGIAAANMFHFIKR